MKKERMQRLGVKKYDESIFQSPEEEKEEEEEEAAASDDAEESEEDEEMITVTRGVANG